MNQSPLSTNNHRKRLQFISANTTIVKQSSQASLKKLDTIHVAGIFDSAQLNPWSQDQKLSAISMIKKGVHNKFFIIDGETMITGSYNPTRNGNEENDENIVIIQDQEIT